MLTHKDIKKYMVYNNMCTEKDMIISGEIMDSIVMVNILYNDISNVMGLSRQEIKKFMRMNDIIDILK
jgi:hypothetical protein